MPRPIEHRLTMDEIRELPALLTVIEAAQALGMSQARAYRLIAEDEFPVPRLRVSGENRFTLASILDYLGIIPKDEKPIDPHKKYRLNGKIMTGLEVLERRAQRQRAHNV